MTHVSVVQLPANTFPQSGKVHIRKIHPGGGAPVQDFLGTIDKPGPWTKAGLAGCSKELEHVAYHAAQQEETMAFSVHSSMTPEEGEDVKDTKRKECLENGVTFIDDLAAGKNFGFKTVTVEATPEGTLTKHSREAFLPQALIAVGDGFAISTSGLDENGKRKAPENYFDDILKLAKSVFESRKNRKLDLRGFDVNKDEAMQLCVQTGLTIQMKNHTLSPGVKSFNGYVWPGVPAAATPVAPVAVRPGHVHVPGPRQ